MRFRPRRRGQTREAEAKRHEAEAEAKARTHEAEVKAEAVNFGLEAEARPRGLTSLQLAVFVYSCSFYDKSCWTIWA